jgi:hypothetical protein
VTKDKHRERDDRTDHETHEEGDAKCSDADRQRPASTELVEPFGVTTAIGRTHMADDFVSLWHAHMLSCALLHVKLGVGSMLARRPHAMRFS